MKPVLQNSEIMLKCKHFKALAFNILKNWSGPRPIQNYDNYTFTMHSAAMVNLTNLQKTLMVPAQGERVCLKDSKYILFENLANRTRKGLTSSYRPSQPDLAIWLAWPAGASTALPCPIC